MVRNLVFGFLVVSLIISINLTAQERPSSQLKIKTGDKWTESFSYEEDLTVGPFTENSKTSYEHIVLVENVDNGTPTKAKIKIVSNKIILNEFGVEDVRAKPDSIVRVEKKNGESKCDVIKGELKQESKTKVSSSITNPNLAIFVHEGPSTKLEGPWKISNEAISAIFDVDSNDIKNNPPTSKVKFNSIEKRADITVVILDVELSFTKTKRDRKAEKIFYYTFKGTAKVNMDIGLTTLLQLSGTVKENTTPGAEATLRYTEGSVKIILKRNFGEGTIEEEKKK